MGSSLLPNGYVEFFNRGLNKYLTVLKTATTLNLFKYLRTIGNGKQNVVYCSSKAKAINKAIMYANLCQTKNDPELKKFAEEIREEIHGDYYLANLVEKGVGYHIGYLPHSIRFRLELLFKEKRINTIFCTSTLLEGVNLPIDNLFLTSYFNGNKLLTPLEFKNLVGRSVRISFNLIGNVFLVFTGESKRESASAFKNYLFKKVEEQKLSIEKHYEKQEKEELISLLVDGEQVIPREDDDNNDDLYDFKRKTALILEDCIAHNKSSRILEEFSEVLTNEKIATIREKYSTPELEPVDDLDISRDQLTPLQRQILNGLEFPALEVGPKVSNYQVILAFLEELADAFNWRLYERETLGHTNKSGKLTFLTRYAVILDPWMQGKGLKTIITSTLRYKEREAKKCQANRVNLNLSGKDEFDEYKGAFVQTDNGWRLYENCIEHNNIVISETLEVINSVILFKLSNYLLKFSEEYKNIHQLESIENNWHDYVEFGTTNSIVIALQKFGFSRETANKLFKSADKYLNITDEKIQIKSSVFEDNKSALFQEATDVKYNLPEIFI